MPKMITILGKLADTSAYMDKPGYNVYPRSDDWTPELAKAWLSEAVTRGDTFQLVSTDFTGVYLQEIRWLQDEAQKLREQASVLLARALELNDAIADISKQAKREAWSEPVSD